MKDKFNIKINAWRLAGPFIRPGFGSVAAGRPSSWKKGTLHAKARILALLSGIDKLGLQIRRNDSYRKG